MSIAHYSFGNINNHNETRKENFFLIKKEIHELVRGMGARGQTIVPTMIYFKGSKVKLEIALQREEAS